MATIYDKNKTQEYLLSKNSLAADFSKVTPGAVVHWKRAADQHPDGVIIEHVKILEAESPDRVRIETATKDENEKSGWRSEQATVSADSLYHYVGNMG